MRCTACNFQSSHSRKCERESSSAESGAGSKFKLRQSFRPPRPSSRKQRSCYQTPPISRHRTPSASPSRTMDDQDIRPHPDAVQVEAEAATKLPPAAAASTDAAPQPEHQKTTEGGSIQPEPAQEEVVSLLCLVWEVHGGLVRGRLAGRELVPLLETAERADWELSSRLLLASRLPILPSTA